MNLPRIFRPWRWRYTPDGLRHPMQLREAAGEVPDPAARGDFPPAPVFPQIGGYLRSLSITTTTSREAPYKRPQHAADRTRSRQALAGSRRAKRHAVPPKGPRTQRWLDDGPWGPIRSANIAEIGLRRVTLPAPRRTVEQLPDPLPIFERTLDASRHALSSAARHH